jgi:hypothetical protein
MKCFSTKVSNFELEGTYYKSWWPLSTFILLFFLGQIGPSRLVVNVSRSHTIRHASTHTHTHTHTHKVGLLSTSDQLFTKARYPHNKHTRRTFMPSG